MLLSIVFCKAAILFLLWWWNAQLLFSERFWRNRKNLKIISVVHYLLKSTTTKHDLSILYTTTIHSETKLIIMMHLTDISTSSEDLPHTWYSFQIWQHMKTYNLYDKRDKFDFPIVSFPRFISNIPISLGLWCAFLSAFFRVSRFPYQRTTVQSGWCKTLTWGFHE